ncbi:MAG: ABC transporter ATP-binding protein [Opitutales bacterium]|nr:ABC transporter ATP-binding protein [Opitutales bacterium]
MFDIRIDKVTQRFGDSVALDQVSLEIRSGELFFLLGTSGCGKTTLLRLLAGFLAPKSGHIYFNDRDVSKMPPYKRKIAMVFQNYALWPHMTVFQNIAFGLQQKKLPKAEINARVQEMLEMVHMEGCVSRKPNELSGGQQQRVALARALATRPQCLLLDEPLSNLDAKLRIEMRSEIRRICKESQVTAVYVTHDQAEALSIADRIAVLSKGKVEQIGVPIDVYKHPRNRFVAHFLGETNFVPGTVLKNQSGEPLPSIDPLTKDASDDVSVLSDDNRPIGSKREVLIQTAIGVFRGLWYLDHPVPQEGDRVLLSLRPEAFKLKTYQLPENSIDGVIGETIYYGEVAHYNFIKNGVTLRISELNPKHLQHEHQMGLFANIKVDDVVVLPFD